METTSLRILLVDETVSDASPLVSYVRNLGCSCAISRSVEEACALLLREKFDLVLTKFELAGGSCHELSTLLLGRQTCLFYSYTVEGGCWWIPRVRLGQDCRGAAALLPSEFASLLKELIANVGSSGKWIRDRRRGTAGPNPTSL